MLKKTITFFLIFHLLIVTTGITIYSHYCGHHHSEKSIYIAPDNCCDNHCSSCFTDIISIRLTDSFIGSKFNVNFNDYAKKLFYQFDLLNLLNTRLLVFANFSLFSEEVFLWMLHPLDAFDRNILFCSFLT